MKTLALPGGRRVHFIDEGHPDWTPMLFLGGAGTSVRAFRLMEFTRTLREQLRVRVVSVERNGLGQTGFDPAVGLGEYAADVAHLGDRVVVCVDGRSRLVEREHVPKVIANGGTLGLCAWSQ